MSKASGSIDLKSLKVAGSGATGYITNIDNNGIFVHPESEGPSDTQTPTGWKIADVIELFKENVSYIKAWVENNVAKIRIGRDDSGNVLIQSSDIAVRDGLTELAVFGATGSRIGLDSGGHTTVNSNGVKIFKGSTEMASFSGTNARIGGATDNYINIDATTGKVSIKANGIPDALALYGDWWDDEEATGKIQFGGDDGTKAPVMFGYYSANDSVLTMHTPFNNSRDALLIIGASNGTGLLESNTKEASLKIFDTSISMNSKDQTSSSSVEVQPDGIYLAGTPSLYMDNSAYYKAQRTDTGTEVWFGCGATSGRKGLYSPDEARWIIVEDGNANIYIGGIGNTASLGIVGGLINFAGEGQFDGELYKNSTEKVVSASTDGDSSSVSLANTTSFADTGVSIDLDVGTYILTASMSFPTGTGRRGLRWYYGGDTNWQESAVSCNAVSGANTRLQVTRLINVSVGITGMKVQAFQNSGSALTCDVNYRYIKLA